MYVCIEHDEKDPKFILGDNIGIPEYKNKFAKGNTPIVQKNFLSLKKLKLFYLRHMLLINDFNNEVIVGTIYEKSCIDKPSRIRGWKGNQEKNCRVLC